MPRPATWIIGQQDAPPWEDILLWSGILLGAVLAGVIVVAVVRRILTARSTVPPQGFTLHELRELHEAGNITDVEYQRAKAAIIARTRAPATGQDEDPAERAVRELKDRRSPRSGPASGDATPPADKSGREDAPRTPESQDGPADSV